MEKKDTFLTTRARSIRDGVEITSPSLNDDVLRDHFRGGQLLYTVVDQSLKANTTVAKGTTVDVTMAYMGDMRVNVLMYFHPGFEDQTIADIAKVTRDDKRVLKIISDNKTPRTLKDAERKVLVEFARAAGVQVDPADKDAVDAVFETARGSFILGGASI